MAVYDDIKAHLEKYPSARERKNKNKFIAWILHRKHGGNMQTGVTQEQIENIIVEAYGLDRAWRQVLLKEPSLRGSDYDQKPELEQKAKETLGYK